MSEQINIHSSEENSTKELLEQQYIDFLNMTAHDLLAPLRKLSVLTERLTQKFEQPADEETKQYRDRILACIEDMRSIVNGCMEIAEAIPENMKITTVDTSEIAEQVLQEKSLALREKGITVLTSGLPVLEADGKQIRILFKEILENAFTFAKKDLPLKIEITAAKLGESEKNEIGLRGDGYWKFIFRDNGIGFKNDETKRIFDPTVKLNGKSAYPGNGLGLTLVKKIVSNHRGCVYAESSSSGSCFTVILPKTQ